MVNVQKLQSDLSEFLSKVPFRSYSSLVATLTGFVVGYLKCLGVDVSEISISERHDYELDGTIALTVKTAQSQIRITVKVKDRKVELVEVRH